MLKILSVFFAFLILTPSLVKMAVVTNYVVQYERYTTELCENKDKPELACNGKCQMMKELNEAEQNNPVAPVLPDFKVKEQPACELSISRPFFQVSQLDKTKQCYSNFELSTGVKGNVFHPPPCC